MLDLTHVLQGRLSSMEFIAQQGVIPGQLDTYELEQLIGRVKELKFIIKLLASDDMDKTIMELKNE